MDIYVKSGGWGGKIAELLGHEKLSYLTTPIGQDLKNYFLRFCLPGGRKPCISPSPKGGIIWYLMANQLNKFRKAFS